MQLNLYVGWPFGDWKTEGFGNVKFSFYYFTDYRVTLENKMAKFDV